MADDTELALDRHECFAICGVSVDGNAASRLDECSAEEVFAAGFDAIVCEFDFVFDSWIADRAFGWVGEAVWDVGCFVWGHWLREAGLARQDTCEVCEVELFLSSTRMWLHVVFVVNILENYDKRDRPIRRSFC